MTNLERLTAEARALAEGGGAHPQGLVAPLSPREAEASRILAICNACRYCEGFCAVFPAMTRRLEFGGTDVRYLAHLCHNCGACLHACQYAPPHEFAVDVPRTMAGVRAETLATYAWPRALGALYRANGIAVSVALAAGLALFIVALVLSTGSLADRPHGGDFYAVFPHGALVAVFGVVFVFALLALALGARRCWRDFAESGMTADAAIRATGNVLTLKYLDGGHGRGCNERDDAFTLARRRFHHLTFYGFLLCFASTSVATLYHYALRWPAPYPMASLPVLLGTAGGIGLVVGTIGLLWLGMRRHPEHDHPAQRPLDRGFSLLLLLTSVTGLALLAWRDTRAMGLLLAVHLGIVLALFVTLPYGKFTHALYRTAALLKWNAEKRRPNRAGIAE